MGRASINCCLKLYDVNSRPAEYHSKPQSWRGFDHLLSQKAEYESLTNRTFQENIHIYNELICVKWISKTMKIKILFYMLCTGARWLVVVLGAEGRWFKSHSSGHIGTLGKTFTRSCLYDIWCGHLHGCLAVRFDFCSNLPTSVHTLLVNILRYVRLYIKNENIIKINHNYFELP